MEERIVEIGESKLKIFDNNGGDRGTIIGIHGLTGNGMQLNFYSKHFAKEGYRVITMDLRGRGESSEGEKPSSIFNHAEDIKALIEALGISNPILMGYSMGGFISAIVASEIPDVKGVVLLDGAATMTEHQKPIVEPSFSRLSKHWSSQEEYVQTVAQGYEAFGIPTDENIVSVLTYEIKDHGDYWENKAEEATIREDWSTFWEFDISKYGQTINVPVLLIICEGNIGSNPPLFLDEHYTKTIESIKDITVFHTPANHYNLVFTRRDDVVNEIEIFLKNKIN
ncbi:alpha/beta fold hydrolase [Fundicoccus culcitae]|uniref:Alpha/beta hydrolase n=1 Tax=Fundicoccus culcitae TaxID=2969821 RepID=A0ABY5P925_9LACT|nr:alpha/beta hydrolase [Fundicoccus culcitae]UUX35095.1 alpha/beta hydrolase [Fundicoccus culcitae]